MTAHTLRAEGFDASEDGTGRGTPLVPVGITIHGTDPSVQKVASYDDTAQCLRARTPGNIDNSSTTVVQQAMSVRRLTPRECERLQGFQWLCSPSLPGAWQDEAGRWWSPDYTAIPWRKKPAEDCPDGPRYKALGNSWAVPCARWIGERIDAQLRGEA